MMTFRLSQHRRLAAPLLFLFGALACGYGKSADEGKVPLGSAPAGQPATAGVAGASGASAAIVPSMTGEAKVALDSGNAAYRRKDYATALVAFEKSQKLAPDDAAPWFGIYMVAQARKDNKAADAALAEIQKRSEVVPAPMLDSAAMKRAHAKAGVGTTGK
ncbi:MAG: hypothetical protein ACYC3L_08825 [Gemmatimonadaceae bacterium]